MELSCLNDQRNQLRVSLSVAQGMNTLREARTGCGTVLLHDVGKKMEQEDKQQPSKTPKMRKDVKENWITTSLRRSLSEDNGNETLFGRVISKSLPPQSPETQMASQSDECRGRCGRWSAIPRS